MKALVQRQRPEEVMKALAQSVGRPRPGRRRPARSDMVAPVPVRFGKDEASLYRVLVARAGAQDRSLSAQIKRYARLGVIAEDNPDLPLALIEGILEGQAELRVGLGQPYQWGVLEREGG